MAPSTARKIIQWRYPPPYDLYDLTDESLEGLLNPDYRYHQVENIHGELLGFCCFGEDARVPGGDYGIGEPVILDIGVGLKPELTGQGRGRDFVSSILDFGIVTYKPERLRATIAKFNQRSLSTFKNLGFVITQDFKRDLVEITFCQLERQV
jgi:RimJ/RimL family protein N-acetyltransferase